MPGGPTHLIRIYNSCMHAPYECCWLVSRIKSNEDEGFGVIIGCKYNWMGSSYRTFEKLMIDIIDANDLMVRKLLPGCRRDIPQC